MPPAELTDLLNGINAERAAGRAGRTPGDPRLEGAQGRLAVYGSLAPGQSNAEQLEALEGSWSQGWVEGILRAEGWGAAIGFPGLVWRPGAAHVAVQVFASADLARHWERLDRFEGGAYLRCLVPVFGVGSGPLVCNLYAIRPESEP